jgi:hypothetical protein
MTETRKFSSVGWFRLSLKRLANLFRPLSLQRLETTLQIFEAELDAGNKAQQKSWEERSKELLDIAWQSLNEGDSEKGWRCLKAADRLRLNDVSNDELENEAKLILAEISDESKEIRKWRQKSIVDLLADCDGKLKAGFTAKELVRAKRTLDEHHDNVYHKLMILKSRLRLLTLIGLLAIAIWIIRPPLSPVVKSLAFATSDDVVMSSPLSTRWLWFAVILSGVLGAVFSGFSSSMATDQNKTRIPAELSTSTLTFARLALSMVSAIVVSIFLLSGVIDFPKPSLEFLLVVAFISGFSDRLLLRAIGSIAK